MKRLKTKLQLNKSTIVDIFSTKSAIKGGGAYTIDRSYCECPPLRL